MYKNLVNSKISDVYASLNKLYKNKIFNKSNVSYYITGILSRKNSKVYKNAMNDIKKNLDELKQKKLLEKKKKYIFETEQDKKEIIVNDYNVSELGWWIHKNEIHDMMKENPNTIIQQKVEFYNENNEQINSFEFQDPETDEIINVNDLPIKMEFIENKTKNELSDATQYKVTVRSAGSRGYWLPLAFITSNNNNYVKIITTSYKKLLNNFNEQLHTIQRYALNDTGTCVYDGLVDYFSKYIGTKNFHGVGVYNKLMKNKRKFAKSYTVEEMDKLGKNLNCSFTIVDLINNKDININKGNAKYNISFVNTRYNHVNLLKCVSKVVDISTKKYNELKDNVNFYVERFGNLLTLDGNYKIKNSYSVLVDDWKNKYNINGCSIEIDSDINKFIKCYDDKVHRFFQPDMIIDNSLYSELDLKKAYFNYNKCNQYNGLPSGAYISCSGEGMTDEIFLKSFKNGLVGFYEVKILNYDYGEMIYMLGLEGDGVSHVLFSATIKLLLDYGVKFEYHNYVVSPSIHAPFSEDFLKFIDEDNLVDDNNDKKDLCKAYCKTVGCMMIENRDFKFEIKADSNDNQFYKTLTKQDNIYYVDGVYKIIKEKENPKSLKHMALAIHAYSSTIILEQLLKMDHNDVFGVKVDSIVFRRGIDIKFDNNLFKEPSKAKIESMLQLTEIEKQTIEIKNQKIEIEKQKNGCDYGLDYGLDYNHGLNKNNNISEIEYRNNHEYKEYFKQYFIGCDIFIDFEPPFCGEHITNRVIFLGGAGGCGKTHSVMTSSNFMKKEMIFTSSCWELIQAKVDEFPDITGLSLPKITGEMNGIKVEKFNINNYKYIVDDELTLQNKKVVNTIIKENKDKFIILMGDIDRDGFYYQCSIGNSVVNPSKGNCQYIKYTKNYRFELSFNDKVNKLRDFMKSNKGNTKKLFDYVKVEFASCFRKRIKDIKFGDDDVGITALKPLDKYGNCKYSKHFYKKGAKEQFYIKDTVFKAGKYKGAKLEGKPENHNYINSLFRTVHSYQGRQLNKDNKIVIIIDSLFDYNLLYTAISRARRLDQIIIFDRLNK